MLIETTIRFHLSQLEWLLPENQKQQMLVGMETNATIMENVMKVPEISENSLPKVPSFSLMGINLYWDAYRSSIHSS